MSEAPAPDVESDPPAPGYDRFDCTTDDPQLLAEAVEAARAAVERGACVVLPTDTVYGIGADAFSPEAVQGLLDAKIRGRDMPPPVLIAEPSLIRALATDVPEQAKDLVARHWPGPLTIICRRQPSLRIDLGDAEDTVALRVPDHELTREVLRSTGPMAVSSANISGMPATLNVDDAIAQLGTRVAVYLDAGPAQASGGAPSTIVDFSRSDDGEVLRHGALSLAVLRETCPEIVDLVEGDVEPEPDSVPDDTQADDPTGDVPAADESMAEEPTADESEADESEADESEADESEADESEAEDADLMDAEVVPADAEDIKAQIHNADPKP